LRSYLDGRVFADVTDGPGPLIVGLHGWGRDRHDFQSALGAYPHLLVDLPGFGLSPPPKEAWGAADYASCMAAALDEHGRGEPVVVVGHSFGGRVAVCLAAARPDLVRGMVLCGVPLLRQSGAPAPALAYRLGRRAHQLGLLSDRRFEAMRRARSSDDYNAAAGVMRQVLVRVVNESYDAQLRAVACPVALLWGSADRTVPAGMVERASALLTVPVATQIVDGASHDVHLQQPDRLGSMIEKVLDAPGMVPRWS
jgi:pimeloyl-ACP methyl ester carboxylesterase